MRAFNAVCVVLLLSLTAVLLSRSVFASEGFDDLVRVLKANEDAVTNHVLHSTDAYDLSVDEILYLKDLGATADIIKTAVNHGRHLRELRARENEQVVVADPAPVVEIETEVVVAPAPEETDLSLFYDALAPNGSWFEVNGTWLWHPTVATTDPSWRPYCDSGSWVYTDSGWAWHSEYSWGWAPFHYGRWTRLDEYGWVWAPDNVWAPAWVSWRTGGDHYGWAPLPPAARYEEGVGFHFGDKHVSVDFEFGLRERDYFFVPAEHMTETRLNTFVVPQSRVNVMYNNTTVIQNNITYNDNRIVNRGPAIEHVRAATGRNIPMIKLADASVKPGQAIHGNTLSANTMVVYRPQVKNTAPVTPTVVVARRQAAAEQKTQRQAVRTENAADAQAKALATRQAEAQRQAQLAADEKARASQREKVREDVAAETQTKVQATRQAEAQRQAQLAADEKARASQREKVREDVAAETQAKVQATRQAEAQRQAQLAADEKARSAAREKVREENSAEMQAKTQARQQTEAQRLAAEEQARAAAKEKASERKQSAETKREEAVTEAQAKAAARKEAIRQSKLTPEERAKEAAEKAKNPDGTPATGK